MAAKKRSFDHWSFGVIYYLFTALTLGAIWIHVFATDSRRVQLPFITSILIWLIAIILSITIHECGHLIGGLVQHMRFLHISIGMVKLERHNDRLRLRISRSARQGRGGQTLLVPPSTQNLVPQWLVMGAAGPTASGLAGVLSGVLLLTLRSLSPFVRELLVSLCLFNLYFFTVNLIPFRLHGARTDGSQIYMLLRGDATSRQLAAGLTIQSLLQDGVRPRDLDPSLIDRLMPAQDGATPDINALMLAYEHAEDSADIDRAEGLLEAAREQAKASDENLWKALTLEKAFFEAFHRGQAESARELQQTAGKVGGLPDHAQATVEASILLAEGRYAEAEASAQQAQNKLNHSMLPGLVINVQETLEEIMRRAREGAASADEVYLPQ